MLIGQELYWKQWAGNFLERVLLFLGTKKYFFNFYKITGKHGWCAIKTFVKIQKVFFKKKFNLLCCENAEIHSTAFFSKKTKITLLQGLSSSDFYMLYIFVVSTAWVKYKNKSWKVSLGYLLFHITTGVIFQMPTLFCFSLGDKKRNFMQNFCHQSL